MEKCKECGKEIKEFSERDVTNHYTKEEGKDFYEVSDSSYDNTHYFCGNCGTEITGEQLERILDQIR